MSADLPLDTIRPGLSPTPGQPTGAGGPTPGPTPGLPAPDARSVDRIVVDLAVRLSLLGLFAYFALWLVAPFLSLILWSIVLSVALYPAFASLRDLLGGRPRVAAFLLTVAAFVVLLGPATVLVSSLVHSLEALAASFHGQAFTLPPPPAALNDLPLVGPTLTRSWVQATSNIAGFLETYRSALIHVGEWVLRAVASLAGSLVVIVAAVPIAALLHFPGPRLVTGLRAFARRVAGGHGSEFVDLAGTTIRNVARGVVGVAAIQSLLIGIGLLVAGVPGAGLLALAALVLAIVQVGTLPVVLPLLIWYWIERPTGSAVLLTAYLVPVSLIDNILKPLLMGKGLPTPMLVILVGVIGGTISFGIIGLFLGPIVLAVFYELLVYWVAEPQPPARRGPPA